MIEIEIINASFVPQLHRNKDNTKSGIDTYCLVRSCGTELYRSEICKGTLEPIYNEKFSRTLEELSGKVLEHHRPFYLEHLEVDIYEVPSSGNKSEYNMKSHVRLYETRVPLSSIGSFKSYRLLSCIHSSSNSAAAAAALAVDGVGGNRVQEGRIFIRINKPTRSEGLYQELESFEYNEMRSIFSPYHPYFRHLYLDWDWSPWGFSYDWGLPGPSCGELIVDRYDFVEWRVCVGGNCFGDRFYTTCSGVLIVTDLRIIFLPLHEIRSTLWPTAIIISETDVSNYSGSYDSIVNASFKSDVVLSVQQFTFQLPLSAIYDCRFQPMPHLTTNKCGLAPGNGSNNVENNSSTACIITVDGTDGSTVDFIVRSGAVKASSYNDTCNQVRLLADPAYRAGLCTATVEPHIWCSRVLDYLRWEQRLDMAWTRWAKYLKLSCIQLGASNEHKWWLSRLRNKATINLDTEFQRMRVQNANWRLSDLNSAYRLCPSYPSVLVFPGTMEEDEICEAASERSSNRLPALVWLHPRNKAPLCRAAQPLAGLSGSSIESDKRLLLAIQTSTPSSLPLRIADARPKMNANANAMQGKGFENISFLGGSTVASLTFLDIDNIHVVRNSIIKLRESLSIVTGSGLEGGIIFDYSTRNVSIGSISGAINYGSGNFGPDNSPATTNNQGVSIGIGVGSPLDIGGSMGDANGVHSSKWLQHIASILRGAIGIADSLISGYPVLVHCSDGWDRTAQLTTLAQLFLDPFYRTIDGFLTLLHKEWCSFGHKFDDRLGRSVDSLGRSSINNSSTNGGGNVGGNSKDISPVCLQMLDCVWQTMRQCPSHFEFSERFIQLIAQSLYSGLFTTFRGNCQRERFQLMRRVGAFEDMTADDFDFSTLQCYVGILLRCPNTAVTLTNPHYCPPPSSETDVLYVRPRPNVGDLELWRTGLFGINNNFHFADALRKPALSSAQAAAMGQDQYTRMKGYLDCHWGELPQVVQDKFELLSSTPYPLYHHDGLRIKQTCKGTDTIPPFQYMRLLRSLFPLSDTPSVWGENPRSSLLWGQLVLSPFVNSFNKFVDAPADFWNSDGFCDRVDEIPKNRIYPKESIFCYEFFDFAYYSVLDDRRREYAARVIQLWFKSLLAVRKAVQCFQYSELQYQVLCKVLQTICSSYFKARYRFRYQLQRSRALFVNTILSEIIENALSYSTMRSAAYENYHRKLLSKNHNSFPTTTGTSSASSLQLTEENLSSVTVDSENDILSPSAESRPAKKSLSSRLFNSLRSTGNTGSSKNNSPKGSTKSPLSNERFPKAAEDVESKFDSTCEKNQRSEEIE